MLPLTRGCVPEDILGLDGWDRFDQALLVWFYGRHARYYSSSAQSRPYPGGGSGGDEDDVREEAYGPEGARAERELDVLTWGETLAECVAGGCHDCRGRA